MDKINIKNLALYYNYDKRFKTSLLSFYFYFPYDHENLLELIVCKQLIQKTNALYKNEVDFNYKLKSLYDMRISSATMVSGAACAFRISVSFVNPLYIKEDIDIIDEAINFLYNTIFNVDFTNEKVELEKNLLLKNLESSYNNKTRYAIKRFKEILYSDPLEKNYVDFDRHLIEKVSKTSVLDVYNKIISSPCYLFLTGDLDINLVTNRLNNYDLSLLTPYQLPNDLNFIDNYHKKIVKVNDVIEEQDINQTIICMGYRSKIRKNSKNKIALSILSGMLGEYFHSTLFQIIREQNSLAYSVSSDVFISKGMLCFYAKISNKNIELVKQIIQDEVKKYQDGIIDLKVFELTKSAKINAILENSDSPLNPLYDLQEELMGFEKINDDILIERINALVVDDIIDVANEFILDTIYVLKGNK